MSGNEVAQAAEETNKEFIPSPSPVDKNGTTSEPDKDDVKENASSTTIGATTATTESTTTSESAEENANNKRKSEENDNVNETPLKITKTEDEKKVSTPFGSNTSSNLFSSFATAAKSNPFNTSTDTTKDSTPVFSFPSSKPSPFSFFSNNNTSSNTSSFAFSKQSSSFFGTATSNTLSATSETTASTPDKTALFSDDSNVVTGEESETVVLELRSKLYSMPPSQKGSWKEVGIGPLRILHNPTTNQYRIVQRRESTPGGAGTKLLLNVNIVRKTCVVSKASLNQNEDVGEKHIVLRMIQKDGIQSYLFKFKMVSDATTFLEKMNEILEGDDEKNGGDAKKVDGSAMDSANDADKTEKEE